MVQKTPKIIAHRGYSAKAPENTMASFKKAVEFGASAIEFDLHLSADGKLVVHHDYALGHPDNGVGDIFKLSYDEISKVDAGSWFSTHFSQEKIPILEDIFKTFKNTIEYEIELKGTTTEFIDKAVSVVTQYNLLSHVEFTSPHLFILSKVKQKYPEIKTGVFFTDFPKWMSKAQGEEIILNTMLVLPADVAHLPTSMINRNLVSTLKANNKKIHAADCNSKETVEFAINSLCDQLSTNEVELALKLSQ